MASILFISINGDGIPLALRFAQEGHLVKIWIKNEEYRKLLLNGSKNPTVINTYNIPKESVDLIISDMVGTGDIIDSFNSKGSLTFGGGIFNDKLELNRKYSMTVAKSVMSNVKIPNSSVCTNEKELNDGVSNGKAVVIKPFNNKVSSLTLVSYDNENRTLKSFIKNNSDKVLPCILQETINGIEITIEGFFNQTFIGPFNYTIEHKRFLDYNKGPNTGCMGNVVWPCINNNDKLVDYTLKALIPLLKKVNYCGPIAVSGICNKDDFYITEFTTRFGYDAIQTYCELLRTPLFDYIYQIALGVNKPITLYRDTLAIGIRLSMPPYPDSSADFSLIKGLHVLNISEPAEKHIWLSDVSFDNKPVIGGVDGVIGCVTARGDTVRDAKKRAYRTINNIVIHKDVQYRSDIGSNIENEIIQLNEWGWINAAI